MRSITRDPRDPRNPRCPRCSREIMRNDREGSMHAMTCESFSRAIDHSSSTRMGCMHASSNDVAIREHDGYYRNGHPSTWRALAINPTWRCLLYPRSHHVCFYTSRKAQTEEACFSFPTRISYNRFRGSRDPRHEDEHNMTHRLFAQREEGGALGKRGRIEK